MPKVAVIAPGAVTAGDDITLPQPYEDIGEVVSAIIADVSGGTVSSATPTKTGRRTFTLDADVPATGIVILTYIAKGEMIGY